MRPASRSSGRLLGALVAAWSALVPVARASAADAESREITAPGPDGELAGTLMLPSGDSAANAPFDAVLILPGSGPVDRDGNVPGAVAAAPYRLLAEGLAARGVASVRVDKRGLGASAGDGNAVTFDAYADDVESWVNAMREVPELSGDAWLAGHSEGALVAIRAAARELPGLHGLALVASPGRPGGAVLRQQLADDLANAPVLAEAYAAIDALEVGESVDADALHSGLQRLFHPLVQDFLRELLRFDPAAELAALGEADDPLPVLIVHGGRDLQVDDEDARLLGAARPDATLVLVADMNHVLKTVDGEGRDANVAAYADPDLPLAPGVADAIADFVAGAD